MANRTLESYSNWLQNIPDLGLKSPTAGSKLPFAVLGWVGSLFGKDAAPWMVDIVEQEVKVESTEAVCSGKAFSVLVLKGSQ